MTVLKLLPMPPGRIVAGQVLWQGRDLVAASAEEMRRVRAKEIAIIFQEPMTSLNPVYSVGEQIAESAAPARGPVAARPRWSARSRCSRWSASRRRSGASTTTRTSSRAACASA